MRILLLGASGFIGQSLYEQLRDSHEVFGAGSGSSSAQDLAEVIDLTDRSSIGEALTRTNPEVVVSCAGVVENSERASFNVVFTTNLLDAILASNVQVQKIVISGSAAEYGVVQDDKVAIKEDDEINPKGFYGNSKAEETKTALSYKHDHGLPVVVARIFNPVGLGMNRKFLIPSLLEQAKKVKNGETDVITVSRKDSTRDYIHVKDVAAGMRAIIENNTKEDVYNIGSGMSTSNERLAELIIENYKLSPQPSIVETAAEPEQMVASMADISRITKELGWSPIISIEQTIKEIVDAEER